MAKVGNLKEVIGTQDSDRLLVENKKIAYGLAQNDYLESTPDFLLGSGSASFLVGGTGDDTYKLGREGMAVVMDGGKRRDLDLINATGIGIGKQSSYILDIDNRHLMAIDINTGQSVLVVDWKKPANHIERVQLSDGEYSYGEIASTYKRLGNYLGNFSWGQLVSERILDLARVGLSPRTINRAIRKATRRSQRLEKSTAITFDSFVTSGTRTTFNERHPLTSALLPSDSIVPAHPLQRSDR